MVGASIVASFPSCLAGQWRAILHECAEVGDTIGIGLVLWQSEAEHF